MAQFDNFYANARRSENDGSYYQRLIKLIKQCQLPPIKIGGL